MKRTAIVVLFLIVIQLMSTINLNAECILLMMIARNEHGKISDCDMYEEFFTSFSEQARNRFMADGWAISYFEEGSHLTGEGKVWFDSDQPDEYYWSNRFSSINPVWEDSLNYYTTIHHLRDNLDTKILLSHVRQATFGGGNVPNPHPFVMNINDRSYTFAHNGSAPGQQAVNDMRDVVENYIELNNWDTAPWDHLLNSPVDSAVYFAFVMAHIKFQNWDVIRGIRDALQNELINNTFWTGKNFIFSDGYDTYAYRSVGRPEQAARYRLEYRILHDNSDRETAVVMTRLPAHNDNVEIDVDELVYIPYNGSPVHFKDICGDYIHWQLDPQPRLISTRNYWTWNSFPILDPNLGIFEATSIETLTQTYRPTGSSNGLDNALKVINETGESINRNPITLDWVYGDQPLTHFDHTSGYKMLQHGYDEDSAALIAGELAPSDLSVTLHPDRENWVGYWLLNSQTVGQALTGYHNQIKSVSAVDWTYNTIRKSSCPNFSMQFGQMYKIKLFDWVHEPVEFSWHNSRYPHRGRYLRISSYFTFEPQPEYQVIDIEMIAESDAIKEIGVFANNTCIGAEPVTDFPLQLLVYPDTHQGEELYFKFYHSDGRLTFSNHQTAVWNNHTDSFDKRQLTAGAKDYKIIKLLAPAEQETDLSSNLVRASVSPNPFNPGTSIFLELEHESELSIEIFNSKGQKIRELFSGTQNSGQSAYYWDGHNDSNIQQPNGVYFYRINRGGDTVNGKMLMLK